MNTATATAYQCSFTGWFSPVESQKSPQNRDFSWNRRTYSGKAHCIKDSVLLYETCGSGGFMVWAKSEVIWSEQRSI